MKFLIMYILCGTIATMMMYISIFGDDLEYSLVGLKPVIDIYYLKNFDFETRFRY